MHLAHRARAHTPRPIPTDYGKGGKYPSPAPYGRGDHGNSGYYKEAPGHGGDAYRRGGDSYGRGGGGTGGYGKDSKGGTSDYKNNGYGAGGHGGRDWSYDKGQRGDGYEKATTAPPRVNYKDGKRPASGQYGQNPSGGDDKYSNNYGGNGGYDGKPLSPSKDGQGKTPTSGPYGGSTTAHGQYEAPSGKTGNRGDTSAQYGKGTASPPSGKYAKPSTSGQYGAATSQYDPSDPYRAANELVEDSHGDRRFDADSYRGCVGPDGSFLNEYSWRLCRSAGLEWRGSKDNSPTTSLDSNWESISWGPKPEWAPYDFDWPPQQAYFTHDFAFKNGKWVDVDGVAPTDPLGKRCSPDVRYAHLARPAWYPPQLTWPPLNCADFWDTAPAPNAHPAALQLADGGLELLKSNAVTLLTGCTLVVVALGVVLIRRTIKLHRELKERALYEDNSHYQPLL
ncbi:hypothetical protein ACHHYP_05009 [Achlya hypogyna]|uniref:Uncharacterized protein n=1 Tax=Achlya hypogyna TaxID=1202772 RepID=A0A1V9YZ44_ACHHY|nr:hypothetical protein ACHHYP_05009 [Achlya hypogyna]